MKTQLSVVGCQLLGVMLCAQEVHIPLNDGWQFQQVGKEQWYPAEVPGVVHTDLLRNGLIPDPYKGSNVDSVQWIENEAWIYKRTIVATDTLLKHGHLDLVFKGLDTFAEVYLNDSLIGKADNMFRTWEWSIKSLLRLGSNELKVIFRSPTKEGAKLRDAYGIQLPHDNDPSGVSPYIRKAAYQFGWDFCPRLVTSGIWQGVEIRGWSKARIFGVQAERISLPADQCELILNPLLTTDDNGVILTHSVFLNGKLFKTVVDPGGKQLAEDLPLIDTIVAANELEVWRPGKPLLHTLRIEEWSGGVLVSFWENDIGFNEITLDRKWDDEVIDVSEFTFLDHGSPLFAKGSNLVPPVMLPTAHDEPAWVRLVGDARYAGMNMIRVWGGGVYPPEAFFDACDTAGIMVWQDYMFANMAPVDEHFLDNAQVEAWQQTERLRHHPCVVLMCGNNELTVAWKNWGWQQRYAIHGADSVRVERDNNDLFNHLGIQQMRDGVAYLETSPLSNWGSAVGLRNGDLHYWGVWHGDSTFASFKNNVGRFVSEYGFQSYPDSALLAKYIDPKELYLGSPAMKRLQRSYKTDRPIWEALDRELGEKPTTLGGFIEGSQRAQALAYEMAIDAHMKAQPHCMGTLLWQLNDCWPGPSWSIIDYDGNPKPAYQAVKRMYSGTK